MIDVLVTSKKAVTDDICVFELAGVDGAVLPPFSAGAHIDVNLPDGMIRQYSLCNHSDEKHRYQIGVLRDPASRGGSKAMHQQVNEGDRLQISEPRNHFPLAHDAKHSILFAGGIGITPILCMVERLAHTGASFELHYCARTPAKAAFVEHIKASSFADNVHFHFDDGEANQKLDAQSLLDTPQPDTHVYVCGPSGFMAHVLDTAEEHQWPVAQLHREYFAADAVDTSNDGSFEVEISSTGQVVKIPADKSVIQVLDGLNIEIPFSCESGICGTCLTRVLEGEPDHRDLFLTEAEQAQNDQFTPCCSRSKSPRLVLDI